VYHVDKNSSLSEGDYFYLTWFYNTLLVEETIETYDYDIQDFLIYLVSILSISISADGTTWLME
jgi:hypothetical protein